MAARVTQTLVFNWTPEWMQKGLRKIWPDVQPITWEKLIAEMNEKIKTPGMANIFWMPIQTRTEMLTTGFPLDSRHQSLWSRPRQDSGHRCAN